MTKSIDNPLNLEDQRRILDRFCALQQWKIRDGYFDGFFLDLLGNDAAIGIVMVRGFHSTTYPTFMVMEDKLKTAISICKGWSMPVFILAGFTDCDMYYKVDPSHQVDSTTTPGKIYIPLTYFTPFEQVAMKEVIEEDF